MLPSLSRSLRAFHADHRRYRGTKTVFGRVMLTGDSLSYEAHTAGATAKPLDALVLGKNRPRASNVDVVGGGRGIAADMAEVSSNMRASHAGQKHLAETVMSNAVARQRSRSSDRHGGSSEPWLRISYRKRRRIRWIEFGADDRPITSCDWTMRIRVPIVQTSDESALSLRSRACEI